MFFKNVGAKLNMVGWNWSVCANFLFLIWIQMLLGCFYNCWMNLIMPRAFFTIARWIWMCLERFWPLLDEFKYAWGIFYHYWANLNMLRMFLPLLEKFKYAWGVFNYCWTNLEVPKAFLSVLGHFNHCLPNLQVPGAFFYHCWANLEVPWMFFINFWVFLTWLGMFLFIVGQFPCQRWM